MKKHIIYGPPGTGKTTRLLSILEKELTRCNPDEIAFVSFTRKGAYEGRARAVEKFGINEKNFPYFRTLHSIAFSAGNFKKDQMLNRKDYKKFSETMGMCFQGYYTEELKHNDDRYLFYADIKRNSPKEAEKLAEGMNMEIAQYVDMNYARFKKQIGKCDFTDMLYSYVHNGEPLPIKVAIIDEAQDLTTLQWQMVDVMTRRCERVYIAGDDDQAIFSWAGADVDLFMEQDGEREILDRSYRLPSVILDYCQTIGKKITHRVDKKYSPNTNGGSVLFYKSFDDVPLMDKGDWMLLSRNNYYLQTYTKRLHNARIYYNIKGEPSIKKDDLTRIRVFQELQRNNPEAIRGEILLHDALLDVYDVTKPWWHCFNWSSDKIEYYCNLLHTGVNSGQGRRVYVNTIHGVKGGQADHVVLLLDITKSVYDAVDVNADNELRCIYVACSRAKKTLHIVKGSGKRSYNRIMEV